MENDPLQQLRDVHLPPDPAWWPPAFGWWLLVLLILAGVLWAAYRAIRSYRKRAPIRSARALLTDLFDAYKAGQLTATEYLHQGNELLKRLLVRGFGRQEYARLSGDNWLAELDRVSESQNFTTGSGRVLGEQRFSREPQVNVEELNHHLQQLLSKVRP